MALELIGSQLNGESNGDYFGFSTALSGDGKVLAVGAPLNGGNEITYYSDKTLYYASGGWTLDESKKQLPVKKIVGAEKGSVKVFKNINGVWKQLGNELIGNDQHSYLGVSVSLSEG